MRRWLVVAVVVAVALAVFLVTRDRGNSDAEETCRKMRDAAAFSMKDAQGVLDLAVAGHLRDRGFVHDLRAECGDDFVTAVDNA